ncbi:MAG TPA: ABC transporter permease [Puia sp.]|nr:ABC transporter permease [Puia sp.]
MLKHYFTIAWRNLEKDRSFTILNLLGLATGLACTILIYLWVSDERQVDTFNKNDSRLFQVLKNSKNSDGIGTDERTPGLLATTLAREIPEVEYATAVIPVSWFDKKGILSYQGRLLTVNEQFAGPDYFKIFSYRLIEGDKEHVLSDRHAIVISRELALKLFHRTDNVVGRSVEWNQKDYSGVYLISGIFEKPPVNATAQFDLVFPYDLFLEKNPKLQGWTNNDPSTYVLLREGTNTDQFNSKIGRLLTSKDSKAQSTLFIQKYSDRYLYNHYENGAPSGGRIEYLRLFSLIALFLLVIACINFMNLSTAKAAGRIKETGIKKVMGAGREMLIVQYLGESLLLSFLAASIAIGLVMLLIPSFNQLTGKQLSLAFTPHLLLAILLVTLLTGVVSGSYPALYLSGFRPAVILRGKISSSLPELLVRKGLVVFQFTISAIFIVSVLVVSRQMQLIQTKKLGYNREHVLYFDKGGMVSDNKVDYLPGGKYEADLDNFLQRVKNVPGVVDAANFRHNITNRNGGTYDISWPGKDPDTRIDFTDLAAGYDFIGTAGIQLKEGRSYSRSFGNEKGNIIFNEAAIETMGLKDPIGKVVHLWGEDRQIIGVVQNFNFQSLHENLKPCFLDLAVNQGASKIMVRVQAGQESETLGRLEKLYKDYNQGEPFEYRFLDEDYQALYSSERRVAALSQYFAGIAIIISCLGLFGLAAFTAQKRQQEIGIRKVVGATVSHIVVLLSKDFLKLVSIALLIAFPLSWWIMSRWLHSFAYRIEPGIDLFLLAGLLTLLLTILSIGYQSVKAAWMNPVRSLKAE